MGAYTFYSDDEINQHLSELNDIELRELITETNQESQRLYFSKEYKYFQKRLFKKTLTKSLFALYVKVSPGEVQCINFAPLSDLKTSSLNFTVDKAFIMTYLFGVLTGIRYGKEVNPVG